MDDQDPKGEDKKWINEARDQLKIIYDKMTGEDHQDTKKYYFEKMEEAFLQFSEGKLDQAMIIYKKLEEEFESHYLLHFRKGEIYFIQTDIENALASFDRSKELLIGDSKVHIENKFRISRKLAYLYWLLGSEYIDHTIIEIEEAENTHKEYKELTGQFETEDEWMLLNNLCWYYLEQWLISSKLLDYNKAFSKLVELDNGIDKGGIPEDKINSNMLDTAAWFHYQLYLKHEDVDSLKKAKRYCKMMEDRPNESTYALLSSTIQRDHVLTILSTEPDKNK